MRLLAELACRRAVACLAAVAITIAPSPTLPFISLHHGFVAPAAAAASVRSTAEPSAESQAALRKAFSAAQAGLLDSADSLLSSSIAEWERTGQAPEEVAALYKTRGGVRQQQGKLSLALTDLSKALGLMKPAPAGVDGEPGVGGTPAAEMLRTYQLRARVHASLGATREQEADLSKAIALLDEVDAITSTNPYIYDDRAKARMLLGSYAAAAEDFDTAEILFKDTGSKIRRVLAAADGAIAKYGAGDVDAAVERMRYVFKVKRDGSLSTNNPDDIALLQELSRHDAELHVAYAAHLFSAKSELLKASRQWESGCVRLETYVVDGQQRFDAEKQLQAQEAAAAEATGAEPQSLRAEAARSKGGSPFDAVDDLRARFNGLDPNSPFVTQRAGSQYIWYKTSEGEVERSVENKAGMVGQTEHACRLAEAGRGWRPP